MTTFAHFLGNWILGGFLITVLLYAFIRENPDTKNENQNLFRASSFVGGLIGLGIALLSV